jgi:hypothetical protein
METFLNNPAHIPNKIAITKEMSIDTKSLNSVLKIMIMESSFVNISTTLNKTSLKEGIIKS